MKQIVCLFSTLLCFACGVHAQQSSSKPLRIAIAGMTHGHVHGVFGRLSRGDIQLVGIYEPDRKIVDRYVKQYGLRERVFTEIEKLLETVKPEAVVAFGPTSDHLKVVQACAPRGVHVMVEKPLALNLREAQTIEALAKKHSIHVLTNYETTWYPSTQAVYDLVRDQQAIGPIRKLVIRDGHSGPKEIGVQEEFLDWLTDPVRNGGGALMDFGCYGANLATWLMQGAEPLSVTAITQQFKPETYPRVEDEATILLTYPSAQAIIEPSWNWPFARKDMEVYGRTGYVRALDGRNMRVRTANETDERALLLEPKRAPVDEPFAYLAAVVRGEVKVGKADLSSLSNNLTVMRILDAARQSARSGKTVRLTANSAR